MPLEGTWSNGFLCLLHVCLYAGVCALDVCRRTCLTQQQPSRQQRTNDPFQRKGRTIGQKVKTKRACLTCSPLLVLLSIHYPQAKQRSQPHCFFCKSHHTRSGIMSCNCRTNETSLNTERKLATSIPIKPCSQGDASPCTYITSFWEIEWGPGTLEIRIDSMLEGERAKLTTIPLIRACILRQTTSRPVP